MPAESSTVYELALLGVLAESPMHGYELRKRLTATLGSFRAFSFGSLYPTLRRLQAAAFITTEDPQDDADAVPLTTRRSRVVYRITADGKERLADLLQDAGPQSWSDDGFGVRLAFFPRTGSETRMRILEGRRRRVEEKREGLRAAMTRAADRLDHLTAELHELGLEASDREVRWLNELIDHERIEQRAAPEPDSTDDAGGGGAEDQAPAESPAAATISRDPPPGRSTRPAARPLTVKNSPAARDRDHIPRPTHHHQQEEYMGTHPIRIAVIGVGNCASSLVQGVEYYRDTEPGARVPGLMHVQFGDYHVSDLQFVAAFDVDAKKVGFDLSEAINSSENNTIKIADVPPTGVTVQRGTTLDGLGKYYRQTITESPAEPVDVVAALREARADVVVCYLPVGSEDAVRFYAQCAIDAGCAFVNALPVFIAGTPEWAEKFRAAGLPIVGDDIKSQVGATITHRVLAKLFEDRGVLLDRTMQLNVGGNMDFMNMLERDRLESKKISKTQSVTSQVDRDLGARNVHIGPSDYVPWLDDRKWAYVRLEGRAFGDVPLNLEYKLEVWDSPNSAGVIIDAVRAAKIAKDRGIGGPVLSASSYFMKSPPVQYPDDQARDNVEKFIRGELDS